jgi:hypothetical protein
MKKIVPESIFEYFRFNKYGNNKDGEIMNNRILDIVRTGGTPEEIEEIINGNPDQVADLSYLLLLATMRNRIDIVKYVLDTYGDDYIDEFFEDSFGNFKRALDYANKKGFKEIASMLSSYTR